jgi:hypothetical protein
VVVVRLILRIHQESAALPTLVTVEKELEDRLELLAMVVQAL